MEVKLNSRRLIEETKKIGRRIRDRNRRFKKLSPEKKRVVIAKDVLKQLELRSVIPTSGTYFSPAEDSKFWDKMKVLREQRPDLEMGAVLEREQCHACAIGSVFIAATRRADDCPVEKVIGSHEMRKYLGQWFSQGQLALMECAFELSPGFARKGDLSEYDDQVQRAVHFGEHFSGAENRLKGIMSNIVANGGEFRP